MPAVHMKSDFRGIITQLPVQNMKRKYKQRKLTVIRLPMMTPEISSVLMLIISSETFLMARSKFTGRPFSGLYLVSAAIHGKKERRPVTA